MLFVRSIRGRSKEGKEDCKDDSSDTKIGQNVYKDNAIVKSRTSDLGVSPDLSIRNTGDNQKFPLTPMMVLAPRSVH